ncbi:RraA family protein [Paenibacillus sp. KQZ6P-2]|uniref:Putative 4-hydroxy-4-methyl-2-oxoglutarate aldolase n=1 Tax=Paenibacillus mangrovi TaxID=2931978 RepID=A0A9X2B444_9BACL|nr:RraA family protein [Paenibacillus mangrovi]MCJ8013605.1 RraA family protein [Paenibacillus mangrovi]
MNRDHDYFDELTKNLNSSVISDILDDFGYRNQTLNSSIRPLERRMKAVGRAYPVLAVDVFETLEQPYDGLIDSLDAILPGDIYVVSLPSGRSAVWGELVSNAAIARGGRGAIVDGYIRDTDKIELLEFPVFSSGYIPRDSKGRNIILQHRVPIECGGIMIQPNDLMFCDFDGIVIIPQYLEDKVITEALKKVSSENKVRDAIRGGMSVREAFDTFGVL